MFSCFMSWGAPGRGGGGVKEIESIKSTIEVIPINVEFESIQTRCTQILSQ